MLPYLLVLCFISCWIALEKKAIGRKSFWLPILVLSLFAGIRRNSVGTDSGTYTNKFINNINTDYYIFDKNVEFGYQFYEYLILKFSHNYFWLFFISSLLITYCYFYIIKKYSVNYWLSVFLFITLGIYTFFFNGLRQALAMAMFALALPFLLEKRFFPYLAVCLFASLFHSTALIMIPFYFLVNLRVKPLYKILATFLGSLLLSRFLVGYVASTNERYESYGQVSEEAGGLISLGFYIILLLFIYFAIRFYKITDKNIIKIFNLYAIGVVFIIPVAILGTMASGPQRLIFYFTWTLVLILPFIFKKIGNIYISIIFTLLSVAYFILTTSRFSNLTPYIINPIFEIF
ncbi:MULTISPECIES: EpsG family protein [Psychrobacter]|uniref:EpsG family protein n=1 Tax=Psychrobacter TaxID=497 RepID=UPI00146A8D02|nr:MULTISPECIES: EpsG family protein [Psychrobacter]